jgi:hypothetical protein
MPNAEYVKVAPVDNDHSGSDDGSDDEVYTDPTSRRPKNSEDTRRYDRETLGHEEEVERLLATEKKGGNVKRKRTREMRMEEGGKEGSSDSARSSEVDLQRLGLQDSTAVCPPQGLVGGSPAD